MVQNEKKIHYENKQRSYELSGWMYRVLYCSENKYDEVSLTFNE